jgi:hypothetical protein
MPSIAISYILPLAAMLGAGLEGPIDDFYGYAEQQEAYLREIGSYSAEIRQARETFNISPIPNERKSTVSLETLSEKTIIDGARFITRSTDFRGYSPNGVETFKHTFSYLLTEDLIAEYSHQEPVPRIKIERFQEGGELPRRAAQTRNLMNPRDILVHGFGDGHRSLRVLCDDLKSMSEKEDVRIEKSDSGDNLLKYTFFRGGARFEVIELDRTRLGMVTGTQLYHPQKGGMRLEVRTILGKLPDGRPFPTSWHHIIYGVADNEITSGRVMEITRNEVIEVVPGGLESIDVSFQTFGLPDGTITVVRYGDSEQLSTGELQGMIVIDGE